MGCENALKLKLFIVPQVQMLQNLIAEQEAKQACLKQTRTPKTIQRDASIQCARTEAATLPLRQRSDVAVQTDFMDSRRSMPS